MERIFVFGSSGMLGNYLCTLLESKGYEVERNDRTSGGIDITKDDDVRTVVKDSDARFVVNCSAYTNVEKAEEESDIAFDVNANAPKYMAQACKEFNIPFVHVSTDYVFGENKEDGYTEDYKTFKPLNVYGESKLEGEKGVLEVGGQVYIFRTSWLFGPNATNFIEKISKYARELPELKVVTDEVGCPTYVGDLSKHILSAIQGDIKPDIYHVCSRDICSRYEFAKEILNIQGIDTPVLESKLKDFNRKAQVPNRSQLLNTKLPEMRTWKEMLREYFGVPDISVVEK